MPNAVPNPTDRASSPRGGPFLLDDEVWKEYVNGITYKQAELKEDLHKLHDALLQELDLSLVELICPEGSK